MRCAKGFAMGNGRAEGVLGTGGAEVDGRDWVDVEDVEDAEDVEGADEIDDDDDEVDVGRGSGVTSMLSSETSSEGGGISSLGRGGKGGGKDDFPSNKEEIGRAHV